MFNSTSLLDCLKSEHTSAFKSWDGFQSTIMMSKRDGVKDSILVVLYNKPTQKRPANLSSAFQVDVDTGTVRIGNENLVDEEQKKAFPEAFAAQTES